MKVFRRRSRHRRSSLRVVGVARVGPRTKDLATRIGKGDIAVIDHRDLDRIAAESLLAAGVAGIVNADHSISGRYPNGGPERVVAAHVPLLDAVGGAVMHDVHDGEVVEIRDGVLWRDGEKVATGELLSVAEIDQRMEEARLRIGTELRSFARNTLEYIDNEAEQSFEPLDLPPLKTKIRGRQALVVVRGLDYQHDLRALRAYIREYRPVLIAVDGGADALIDDGRTPDIIIGDFDSLSPVALHCGAELIHHVHPDGRVPGSNGCWPRGCTSSDSSPRGQVRTRRCSSRSKRARISSLQWVRTRRWSSSSTRAAAAWRRRFSRACDWARSSSTPRV